MKEREYKKIAIENHYFAIVETKSQESGITMDERESKKEEMRQKRLPAFMKQDLDLGALSILKHPGLQEYLDISKL